MEVLQQVQQLRDRIKELEAENKQIKAENKELRKQLEPYSYEKIREDSAGGGWDY